MSRAIFGFLVIAAFAFIFGSNIYAQFARLTGPQGYGYGYGHGYGYGYGVGSDNGQTNYRTTAGAASSDLYGYGYGLLACTAVSNGTTDPSTCAITCNSGYYLSGSSCLVLSSGGGGGGGGGGFVSSAPACTAVTYGDYSTACFGLNQIRSVVTRTPDNCTLTAAQVAASERACVTSGTTGSGVTSGASNSASSAFVALEKSLVKKVNLALAKRLSGRILLQVQEQGQAWYVYPVDLLKYFLGRPADAFAIMRKLSLGVSEKDYTAFAKSKAPARLAGRILLRVKAHGEAYYVNPLDLKLYSLGRPADAFTLMRKFGLGITNANLRQIGVGIIK